MADHVLTGENAYQVRSRAPASEARLDRTTTAFGLAAAIVAVFSTLLTWAKEAYVPLHDFMASLTGHHWTTHGIVDVLLWIAIGFVLLNTGIPERVGGKALTTTLIAATIAGAVGLLGWFVLH